MAYQTSWAPEAEDPLERIKKVASKSAVVIFSKSSCCMCHAMKKLLYGMGVNPTVHELNVEDPIGKEMERGLMMLVGSSSSALPIVFIGGMLVGPMESVMSCHINGTLVHRLKAAGALWL